MPRRVEDRLREGITPFLPVPLEGPAIFVSHGGEAFPSLTIVLQGYGVTIDLVGSTFISKSGITSTTFKTVPDQPVSTLRTHVARGPVLRARRERQPVRRHEDGHRQEKGHGQKPRA